MLACNICLANAAARHLLAVTDADEQHAAENALNSCLATIPVQLENHRILLSATHCKVRTSCMLYAD